MAGIVHEWRATKTWRIYATRNLENFMYVDAWERGNIVDEVRVRWNGRVAFVAENGPVTS